MDTNFLLGVALGVALGALIVRRDVREWRNHALILVMFSDVLINLVRKHHSDDETDQLIAMRLGEDRTVALLRSMRKVHAYASKER